jgi:hypothetical protein
MADLNTLEGKLGKVNETAGEESIGTLVEWAQPIQERHESEVREAALSPAADEA